jgi:peptide/nickel transport system ATP-binding protein
MDCIKMTKERKAKTIEILERVGLGAEYFNRYPHEFSGAKTAYRNS